MAKSFNCHCGERKKLVYYRKWFVTQRNENTSAFNGYHPQYSKYSTVVCSQCLGNGRTKANYVKMLKDAPEDWYNKFIKKI